MIHRECGVLQTTYEADMSLYPLPIARWTVAAVAVTRLERATAGKGINDRFERVIELAGNLNSEERQRLLEIADRCPVSQTLRRSSEIASLLAEPAEALGPAPG